MLKTIDECIEYIHSVGRFGKKAGLDNIKALLLSLGNPQKELKFIHVAGTNGKGSVACMISNILKFSGFKVGMNTSPYIEEFNERLQINNCPIKSEKLVFYTNIVKEQVQKLNKQGIYPIEFELITAIGFLYFRDECCDYVVLECGLGGRFDATNIIEKPVISAICSLGLDHTEILGDTIEKIAFEKAGIIKENAPVALYCDIESSALEVIEKRAKECNSKVIYSKKDYKIVSSNLDGTVFEVEGRKYEISLLGEHQVKNALLAISVAEKLNISYEIIQKGIKNSRWKCRFEKIGNFIIDGAHNSEGIKSFVNTALENLPSENILVIGMLNDKNFETSAAELAKLKGKFIITDVPSYRQTDGNEVYNCIKKYIPDAVYVKNFGDALSLAISLKTENEYICIAGSLYLAGAVRTKILNLL